MIRGNPRNWKNNQGSEYEEEIMQKDDEFHEDSRERSQDLYMKEHNKRN